MFFFPARGEEKDSGWARPRFEFDFFANRTGSTAKRLIALASLPSRILISRTFENSRICQRRAERVREASR
jgi:hypothetical protein